MNQLRAPDGASAPASGNPGNDGKSGTLQRFEDSPAWTVETDALLSCLVFLTKYHGRPRSDSVLRSGLPLGEAGMSLDMFSRAAARASLRTTILKRRFDRIHRWTLPAVVLLEDRSAAVLVSQEDDGTCLVVMGEPNHTTVRLSVEELKRIHSGYVILVKPEFAFSAQTERDSEFSGGRSWFWGTLAANWWTYGQVALASVLINAFALANPLFTMNVYDRVLPNNAVETALALAVGVGIVLLFDFLLRNLRGWFIDFVGRRADVILACRIFDRVLDMKISHRPASSGAFASMLSEFETIREFFTSATLAAFIDLPFALLFIVVIALISPELGMLVGGAALLVLLWSIAIQIPLGRSVRRAQAQGEHKHGVLVESLNGVETIKMVGAEGRMRAMWEALVGQNAELGQRIRLFNNLGVNFVQFVQQSTAILTVLAGVFLVKDGLLTAGGLIAAVILSGRALGPMAQVAQLMMRFHQSASALKSLNALMETPVERPPEANFVHRPHLAGRIEFQKVGFRYPNTDVEVLHDVSFKIEPGERVGIVGRVGSGKSTVAKLLAGLFEPETGSVLLDDTDIRQIEPSDTRANIGFVPQELFLFRGTIKENITMAAPQASDMEITEISEAIGLHDFITHHPLGYDLQVGERGDGLSGGQRQSVALARALIKRPGIMVLDEPTSSMDTTTERLVISALPRFMDDRTIVLITHRTTMLQLVDRLIVLDRGRVVADGTRETVLEGLSQGRIKTGA